MPTPASNPCPLTPVATFHSPLTHHPHTPRQPRTRSTVPGRIEVHQGYQNLLRDLEGFSHVWVLFWCHHARGWNDLVVPPRDPGGPKRGLFATRAPHRPNPIGISALEILRIDRRDIHVGAHDILDGSPIVDLKPYLAYTDSIPEARGGWVDELPEQAGPDHRDWRAAAETET